MKKKPVYRYGTPRGIETKGTANGEVKTYTLSSEELELYRAMPRIDHALEKILNRSYKGDDIA